MEKDVPAKWEFGSSVPLISHLLNRDGRLSEQKEHLSRTATRRDAAPSAGHSCRSEADPCRDVCDQRCYFTSSVIMRLILREKTLPQQDKNLETAVADRVSCWMISFLGCKPFGQYCCSPFCFRKPEKCILLLYPKTWRERIQLHHPQLHTEIFQMHHLSLSALLEFSLLL